MSLTNILNQDSFQTKHQNYYALHSDERRAASHKYYHEKRKFVLQERRRLARERKQQAKLAARLTAAAASLASASPSTPLPNNLPVTGDQASSPLPPSTPPSVEDSEEEDTSTRKLDSRILRGDIDDLEKRFTEWEKLWGGRRLWKLVSDKVRDTSCSGQCKSLDDQLHFEHEHQISDGREFLEQILRLADHDSHDTRVLHASAALPSFHLLPIVIEEIMSGIAPVALKLEGHLEDGDLDGRMELKPLRHGELAIILAVNAALARKGLPELGQLHEVPRLVLNFPSDPERAAHQMGRFEGWRALVEYTQFEYSAVENRFSLMPSKVTIIEETRHIFTVDRAKGIQLSSTLQFLYCLPNLYAGQFKDAAFPLLPSLVRMENSVQTVSFHATPNQRALIRGLGHQFLLARLYDGMDAFKVMLFNEWAFVYPQIKRLDSAFRAQYLEQVWSFSKEYLDTYSRMSLAKMCQHVQTLSSDSPLRISSFPNALQQRFLSHPLSELSVMEFMEAEAQVARDEAQRKADDLEEIKAMNDISISANLILYNVGYSLCRIRQSTKENRPLDDGEEENEDPPLEFIIISYRRKPWKTSLSLSRLGIAGYSLVSTGISGQQVAKTSPAEKPPITHLFQAAKTSTAEKQWKSLEKAGKAIEFIIVTKAAETPPAEEPSSSSSSYLVARFVFLERFAPRITPPPGDGTVNPHALYNWGPNASQVTYLLDNFFVLYVAAKENNGLEPFINMVVSQFNAKYPPLAAFSKGQRRVWDTRLAEIVSGHLETFCKWRKRDIRFKLVHRRSKMDVSPHAPELQMLFRRTDISLDAVSALLVAEDRLKDEKEALDAKIDAKVKDAEERTRNAVRQEFGVDGDASLDEESDKEAAQVEGAVMASSDTDLDPADDDLGPESEEEVVPSSQPEENYYIHPRRSPRERKPARMVTMSW
ncbi:hypothetical protein C8J56DRAFT_1043422 [Mycena floridula]|nr:hypothetical protein C8J56DRAFT_1043422 [Mycena floridula]